jgi:O-antigen ligase
MERRKSEGHSKAVWIPLAWMFLAGSRYVAAWLNLSAPGPIEEGNPVNAASFSLLIGAGVFVLLRRKIDWTRVLTQNKWVWLYFMYCGISIIWSDYPFISFKRWIKELGNPIMVLVILTEKRPYEAVGVILRRLAFLWLPLSILFIKYYPALGRGYTQQGRQMFTGVGDQKNSLGAVCLICGIYFFWNFLLNRKESFKSGERSIINFMLMAMVIYLLHMANSATSLACLVVAAGLFFISRIGLIAQKPDRIILLGIVVAAFFLVLDEALDLDDVIFGILGRDPGLTTRKWMWQVLEEIETDPLLGTGYQSFWLGKRLSIFYEKVGVLPGQAHNGYLEQYLNLGYIGVAFIVIIMVSGLLKVRRHLNADFPPAMLRLSLIVTAALYNYTEASFYGINVIWLLTLLGIFEISQQRKVPGPIIDYQIKPST